MLRKLEIFIKDHTKITSRINKSNESETCGLGLELAACGLGLATYELATYGLGLATCGLELDDFRIRALGLGER